MSNPSKEAMIAATESNGKRELEPPHYVITGARVTVDMGRLAGGFVSCPLNLASEVALVDEEGSPLTDIDLRASLHQAVDIAVNQLELMQRGEA